MSLLKEFREFAVKGHRIRDSLKRANGAAP